MDRDACRARRRQYCASRGDLDPRGDDLCSCYLPTPRYSRIVADAVGKLAVTNQDQLRYIQDLVQTNILTPSCWYGPCTLSMYGGDTEIEVPCQSIGLCVQAIEGTGGITAPVINLTNSCTINNKITGITLPTTEVDATLPVDIQPTEEVRANASNVAVADVIPPNSTILQESVNTTPPVIIPSVASTYTFNYTWLYIILAIVIILLLAAIIYLIVRYNPKSKALPPQPTPKRT